MYKSVNEKEKNYNKNITLKNEQNWEPSEGRNLYWSNQGWSSSYLRLLSPSMSNSLWLVSLRKSILLGLGLFSSSLCFLCPYIEYLSHIVIKILEVCRLNWHPFHCWMCMKYIYKKKRHTHFEIFYMRILFFGIKTASFGSTDDQIWL